MKKLFSLELAGINYWFDYLDSDYSCRLPHQEMDLNTYLKGFEEGSFLELQLGDPEKHWIGCTSQRIRIPEVKQFLFYQCTFTEANFNLVSKAFKEAYGLKLQ